MASYVDPRVEQGKKTYAGAISFVDKWNEMQARKRAEMEARRAAAPQQPIKSGGSVEDFEAGGMLGKVARADAINVGNTQVDDANTGVRLQRGQPGTPWVDTPTEVPIRDTVNRLAPRLVEPTEKGMTPAPQAPTPIANQPGVSKVAQIPLTTSDEATKITTPDGSTRWAVPGKGYMDAATPKATSTNNALGITDEAFSPGGSFSVASGPRPSGMSQAEWDGLSQEEATAIRVAQIEKQASDLRDLHNVRAAKDFKSGGPLTVGARSVLEDISGGAPIEGYTRGTKDWRAENSKGPVTTFGGTYADDFAFADKAEAGMDDIQGMLKDGNPKTRRAAIAAIADMYDTQMDSQPQVAGPDFGDRLDAMKMGLNQQMSQATLAQRREAEQGKQNRWAADDKRKADAATLAEQKVLHEQLREVMNSRDIPHGTSGLLREMTMATTAHPDVVADRMQAVIDTNEDYKKLFQPGRTSVKDMETRQTALEEIRSRVLGSM